VPISKSIPKVTPALLYTSTSSGGFNAATYGTVLFWLDGSDNTVVLNSGGTPCTDGTKVDKWTDKGSGNMNARQTTDANRPVYETAQQNSLSVVQYTNTSDQYFTFENGTGVAQNKAAVTLVMVMNPTLQEQYQMLLYVQDNGGADRISTYVTNQGGGNYKLQADINRTDGGPSYGLYDAGDLAYGAWDIVIWEIDYANGTWAIYNRNSTVRVSSTTQFGGTGSTSNTAAAIQPQLGQYSGSTKFNGQMGEAILYNGTLSAPTRSGLKTALGTKWGITVS
jgi:hypothetical protein